MADKVAFRDALMFRLGMVSGHLSCTADQLKKVGVLSSGLDGHIVSALEDIGAHLQEELEDFSRLVQDARRSVPRPEDQKAE